MKDKKFIEIKKDKNHVRNKIIVNLITAVRSLGTIAIVPIFTTGGSFAAALASIGFFATDFLDGFLARKLHVQSFFGTLLDALSDKTFGIVCLLLLSTLNPIFLVMIGIELGIFAINYKSIERGNNVQTSTDGRIKTGLMAASIVGSLFAYGAPTLKELLNYINVSSFNTLLELNPNIISTILAIPTIGYSIYVANDYRKKATTHDRERQVEEIGESAKTIADYEQSICEIHQEKRELLEQKVDIINQKCELKSKGEVLHDLFDTEFYLEHKDDGYKKLLFK